MDQCLFIKFSNPFIFFNFLGELDWLEVNSFKTGSTWPDLNSLPVIWVQFG